MQQLRALSCSLVGLGFYCQHGGSQSSVIPAPKDPIPSPDLYKLLHINGVCVCVCVCASARACARTHTDTHTERETDRHTCNEYLF